MTREMILPKKNTGHYRQTTDVPDPGPAVRSRQGANQLLPRNGEAAATSTPRLSGAVYIQLVTAEVSLRLLPRYWN